MEFIPSKLLTVGIELELQFVNKESLDLADGILPLMELYPGSPYVKPEMIQNTVEIASRIGNNVSDVHAHMSGIAKELRQNVVKLEMQLFGSGSHPFSQRLGLITPLPRYLRQEQEAGHLSHTQITYATHVHVGVQSGDESIYVLDRLKPYLPLLIALSANSPFWRGFDTGFVSYRHRILAATRSYGIPPTFNDWQQFVDFFLSAQRANLFETINDIHWDIRPRPHLGTVEIRVMDAQSTLSEAMQLGALVRVLAQYLLRNTKQEQTPLPHPLPWWIEKDNHYQATRLGLSANYIYNKDGQIKPLIEIWEDVIAELMPVSGELGERKYLEALRSKVAKKEMGYLHQKNIYSETASFEKTIETLISDLYDDVDSYPVPAMKTESIV